MKGVSYEFDAQPWPYAGKGAWVFVSLPKAMAVEIRSLFGSEEEGWGRLKASAQIGGTEWRTAIWYDGKAETYLLPLKAAIRKKEAVTMDTTIKVRLWI